jgi:hypothetical protein
MVLSAITDNNYNPRQYGTRSANNREKDQKADIS